MLRALRIIPSVSLPLFSQQNAYDKIKINQFDNEKQETGWDRVKAMYSKNEYDEHSVELHTVIQSSLCGAFIGACMGGFFRSREAYIYFIENNQATIFTTTASAKKKLQDYVTVAFCKGAYQWGWRLGTFMGIFTAVSTTVAVYRGDTSLVDFIIAGALSGAMYKANLGPAATVVGAALGAALSTVGGLAIIGLLSVTGISMDQIRKSLYAIKQAREDQYNQAVEKSSKIKNDVLTKHHDQMVLEKGEQKIEEIV